MMQNIQIGSPFSYGGMGPKLSKEELDARVSVALSTLFHAEPELLGLRALKSNEYERVQQYVKSGIQTAVDNAFAEARRDSCESRCDVSSLVSESSVYDHVHAGLLKNVASLGLDAVYGVGLGEYGCERIAYAADNAFRREFLQLTQLEDA